ncbi:hypothetical protein A3L14_00175 [Thermococcus thioreducens]|nr:hypothetical protein A3L14_00175 [Thermococcus thioreducens]SEW07447.1 hypothetical protein SAMN05216170_1404 [Thermococcus thioreducens]
MTGRNNPPFFHWLPVLILFRLGFRFVTLLDSALGLALFYNAQLLLHLPRFLILTYPILMGIVEAHLLIVLRKGGFPFKLLMGYFIIAIIFEFPYALVKSGYVGLLLFALFWYITAPSGLLLVLISS